ncbi:MAG: hypothetical protein Q8P90_02710 [bacterium]|nr:hypothetical protein [bacterium]
MNNIRSQVISNARQKQSADEANQDTTNKQAEDQFINASYLTVEGVSLLPNQDDLMNLLKNHIDKNGNPDDEINIEHDKSADTIICSMREKNLVKSLADNVCNAFKGNAPNCTYYNPENNEFYRATVTFKKA